MAIAATDILFNLSVNHQDSDTGTQGGARLATGRVLDDQFTAAAQPDVVSDSASDVQLLTIVGRLASGAIDTEALDLTGTTPVLFTKTFERILTLTLDEAAIGTITVKEGDDGTTRHTFAAAELTARALFYGAAAEASGGDPVLRYEKVFVENNHATLAALALYLELTTDPRLDYDIALETSIDGSESTATRIIAPTSIGSFGKGPLAVTGTDLEAGTAQGVWVRQTLDAGTAPALDEPVVTVDFNTA